MKDNTPTPGQSIKTAANTNKLSKAKDLAAQKHGYADWYQLDCLEIEPYERDEIKTMLLDDVAIFYADQFHHHQPTEVEINKHGLALTADYAHQFYNGDQNDHEDFYTLGQHYYEGWKAAIQWIQNYQQQQPNPTIAVIEARKDELDRIKGPEYDIRMSECNVLLKQING